MRLLHFSDIHFGLPPHGFAWMFDKRLLGTMTQFLRRRHRQDMAAVERLAAAVESARPDWVVCTGDLTAVSAPCEFDEAIRRLKPLREAVEGRFVYLPGNHDAYVRDDASREALMRTMKELNGFDTADEALPVERLVGNVRLLFMDGACPMRPWRSAGRLAEGALERVRRCLEAPRNEGERRVLVSHFPLYGPNGGRLGWRRGLEGDMELRALCERGFADVLLCGHIHHPFRWEQNGFTQYCAGSVTLSRSAVLLETVDDSPSIDGRFLEL